MSISRDEVATIDLTDCCEDGVFLDSKGSPDERAEALRQLDITGTGTFIAILDGET